MDILIAIITILHNFVFKIAFNILRTITNFRRNNKKDFFDASLSAIIFLFKMLRSNHDVQNLFSCCDFSIKISLWIWCKNEQEEKLLHF